MPEKFNILITNTKRSIQYLKLLNKKKLFPNQVIYLDDNKKNNISHKLKKILYFKKYNLSIFKTNNINNFKVVKCLTKSKIKNIIYSGYPTKIVKSKKLLKEKNLIHSHPGFLPYYKGSTTIYYSILNEKKIYCTTFIMNEKIDSGKILLTKRYKIPKKIRSIDIDYDNEIRSNNICNVIKKINLLKKKKQKKTTSLPYYIIHPVLRSIVFNKRKFLINNLLKIFSVHKSSQLSY